LTLLIHPDSIGQSSIRAIESGLRDKFISK